MWLVGTSDVPGNLPFRLTPGQYIIGRTRRAQVVIVDATVSRRHARLVCAPGRLTLEDLNSSNGTRVNDLPISSPCEVRVGDHVQYDEIMGHADHLGNDVMYLLHYAFVQLCVENAAPPRCLNYGSWYSGANPFSPQGGLNRWKRKVNFKPAYLILASS